MAKELLVIKDLVIDYGLVTAVKGINMKVKEGTIVAILGSNGAGKTSTIRAISGVAKAASGSILFDDLDITNLEPYKISKYGIYQSPEGRMILNGLCTKVCSYLLYLIKGYGGVTMPIPWFRNYFIF